MIFLYIPIIGKSKVGKSIFINKLNIKKLLFLNNLINNSYYLIFYEISYFMIKNINFNKNIDLINKINKSLIIILLINSLSLNDEDNNILFILKKYKIPIILIINNINYISNKKEIFFFIKNIHIKYKLEKIYFIKYKCNKEIFNIIEYIYNFLNKKYFLYKKKIINLNEKEIIHEIIKENFLLYLFKLNINNLYIIIENNFIIKNILHIYILIRVKKLYEKKVIIGKSGNNIKNIGIKSRKKLELFFNKKIYLKINIKNN